MQSDLKVIVFPETTNILKPLLATIKKGVASKKDKPTKHDPSYFEHVEASLSCDSNLTLIHSHIIGDTKNKVNENN